MPFYGSLDSLLEYAPSRSPDYFAIPPEPESDEAGSLEDLLADKVRALWNILGQIEREIQGRKDLSGDIIYRISQHYCYLKTKLYELDIWPLGASRSIENRRSGLEKQLDTLNQEQRREQVQRWQDIALLKKEFREWFKQYCDLVQRVKIVLGGKVSSSFNRVIVGKNGPHNGIFGNDSKEARF